MDVHALLVWINARHGTNYELLRQFDGGLQGGAYRLRERGIGRSAVLKLGFADNAPPVIARLRGAGYPTPAWLAFGELLDGTRYVVMEQAEGRPMARLTAEYLAEVLRLNRLQADLNAVAEDDSWSRYASRVVFADESGWAETIGGAGAAAAAVLRALQRWVGADRNTALPFADAVHGDFAPDNLLVADGRISAVIDIGFAGYGTRVIDLALLIQYGYAFGYAADVRAALVAEALGVAGPATLWICLVYRTMAMLEWSIRQHDPAATELYVRAAWQMLGDWDHPH